MRRLALLLLLPAACLLLSVFGFFYFRDNFTTHYPIKVLSQQAFRAGEIPWWNFADGGGQPLAGNPNTLTFYPDNVLYVLLPAHVAFNLHFLIHLVAAWFAMRALAGALVDRREAQADEIAPRATSHAPVFAAWLYVLSGFAMSATAFYTLITALPLIPFSFWAAERRKPLALGAAFGLMALATEPVTILASAIGVAIIGFRRLRILHIAGAVLVSVVIASPQLIAYSEIASEVERARGFSAQTTLNASIAPRRIAELAIGPVFEPPPDRLFLSLFIGVIVLPALFQRSRYVALVLLMIFLALGRYNPVAAAIVEALPRARIGRYPEKFMMVAIVALIALSAMVYERAKEKRFWLLATFVPLLVWLPLHVLVDSFEPYRAAAYTPARFRIGGTASPGGQAPSRIDYRERARRLEPLFGAVVGMEYALTRSPDNMHSLLSRIALERSASANHRWGEIATAPYVMVIRHAIAAPTVNAAVQLIESTGDHVAPSAFDSAPNAQVLSYARKGQTIVIDAVGPALLSLNQSYFTAWDSGSYRTVPVDLDRLGVIVPAGTHHIELRFGRHRTMIIAAWVLSWLTLIAAAIVLLLKNGGPIASPPSLPSAES